eukprot:2632272-Amphidinium_carterae.1
MRSHLAFLLRKQPALEKKREKEDERAQKSVDAASIAAEQARVLLETVQALRGSPVFEINVGTNSLEKPFASVTVPWLNMGSIEGGESVMSSMYGEGMRSVGLLPNGAGLLSIVLGGSFTCTALALEDLLK